MSQTSRGLVKTGSATRPRFWLLAALGAVLIAICFFSPARQVANVQLDPSNYASYAYFTARDFQFGTAVVPVAGPYGFVPYGSLYAGQLFGKRFALELLTKLVFGSLIVWYMRRTPGRMVLGWLWFAALLVMTPLVEDLPYDLAILLAGLCLVELHPLPDRRTLVTACALAAYLALLTLFKGTQAMLALGTLGLLGLQAVILRDFRRVTWIAGAYVIALVGWLAAAGQNPLNLPRYLHGVLELSAGYNAAMVLDEPRAAFLTGGGALLALELLVLTGLLTRWRQPSALAGGLLLAGFTFIEWKHGFVRADGHVYIFYQYACIAAPTILLWLGGGPRWSRWCGGGLAVVAFGLGLWADGPSTLPRHLWAVRQLPARFADSVQQIVAPGRAKQRLDAAMNVQRDVFQLPQVREFVGKGRIDFFGTELGYLMLNQLNYRPRPMGGGTFSVFTRWLQDLNTAYVADPATRPDYFLVSPQTIDQRFLAQDDPGTLRGLLELYAPVATEQGLVLFRARPGHPALTAPRPLGAQSIQLDEPVSLPVVRPDEMLLVSLVLPRNLPGRVRALLYKPPVVFMDLEGEGIVNPGSRRVVPEMFQTPVPLNPVLEDIHDLLALYQGLPGKTVRRFTLHTEYPGVLAGGRLQAYFYAAPRPVPEPEMAARLIAALSFPLANVTPLLMVPANSPPRQFDGLPVQMLEPPGRIRFALGGDERSVSFKYGMDAESYTRGRTDGVEFIVDLEAPGQPPHTLFRRWLQPRTVPADQGTQTQRVVLPPLRKGSTLSLRTDPGPNHDGAWDWSYYTGIRLLSGPSLPEQFPRFNRLPVAVDAVVAGALPDNGRELFMLNSPGSLTFALQGSEKKLTFTAGLLPGAYTQGGQSDGVEFLVDLRAPDGTVARIFRQRLNPRDNPADRGDRPFTVSLPELAPGAELILTASPGPDGNAAWDWSYVESLHFD